jgi:hypothetical protein
MARRAALVACAIAAAAIAAPQTAHASDLECAVGMVFGVAIGGVGALGGIITAVGTGVTRDDMPPLEGWRSASWVFGTWNLISGVGLFGIAATDCDSPGAGVVIALPNLAIAATNFGLAADARSRADEYSAPSEEPEPKPALTVPLFEITF